MPTYEYVCKSCGERLEVRQAFSDDPLTECPECAGTLRKLFGNVGITFKGGGFYKTDSRGSSTSSSATSSGSSGGSTGEASGGSNGSSGGSSDGASSSTPASTSTSSTTSSS